MDKLDMVVKAMRKNPNMTNEQIAKLLGLSSPFSAISWKVKAKEILEQESKGKR